MFKLQSMTDADDYIKMRYLVSCPGGTEERHTTISDVIFVSIHKMTNQVELNMEITSINAEDAHLGLAKLANVLRKYADSIDNREKKNLTLPV